MKILNKTKCNIHWKKLNIILIFNFSQIINPLSQCNYKFQMHMGFDELVIKFMLKYKDPKKAYLRGKNKI